MLLSDRAGVRRRWALDTYGAAATLAAFGLFGVPQIVRTAILVLKGADDALQSNWAPRSSAADIIEDRFCDFCRCLNAQATTFSWGWLDVPISLLYEVFVLLRQDTREDLSDKPFYRPEIVSEPEFFAARKLS